MGAADVHRCQPVFADVGLVLRTAGWVSSGRRLFKDRVAGMFFALGSGRFHLEIGHFRPCFWVDGGDHRFGRGFDPGFEGFFLQKIFYQPLLALSRVDSLDFRVD